MYLYQFSLIFIYYLMNLVNKYLLHNFVDYSKQQLIIRIYYKIQNYKYNLIFNFIMYLH